MRMSITLHIDATPNPTVRVDEIAKTARVYCETAGIDPAESVMMLLCAAARVCSDLAQDKDSVPSLLVTALASAVSCAADIEWLSRQQDQINHSIN